MTREESIEEIAYDIDSLYLFKLLEGKYRHSRMGIEAHMTITMLKDRIARLTKRHKKDFAESVNVKILESLV